MAPAEFFVQRMQHGSAQATTSELWLVCLDSYPLTLTTILPLDRALLLLLLALLVPTMLGT